MQNRLFPSNFQQNISYQTHCYIPNCLDEQVIGVEKSPVPNTAASMKRISSSTPSSRVEWSSGNGGAESIGREQRKVDQRLGEVFCVTEGVRFPFTIIWGHNLWWSWRKTGGLENSPSWIAVWWHRDSRGRKKIPTLGREVTWSVTTHPQDLLMGILFIPYQMIPL